MRILLALLALGILGVAALLAGDSVYIGLFASADVIGEYHFGSESMSGHGGFAYESRRTYMLVGLGKAVLVGVAGVAILLFLRKSKNGGSA